MKTIDIDALLELVFGDLDEIADVTRDGIGE